MNDDQKRRWLHAYEDFFLNEHVIAGRLGRRLETALLGWDATSDLAQATWEWPLKPRAETLFQSVLDREAKLWDLDWQRNGQKEFARQLYSA